jgi:allantoate deiminase
LVAGAGAAQGREAAAELISAGRIMARAEALAAHSEQAGGLTRVSLSPQYRAAAELVMGWMREAGMAARLDAIGNVAGRYEGERVGLPCLMLGSHLDTVRDAGKYDGMLGVICAIECVQALHARGTRLPFALEVMGFTDEEGVRFGVTLLGSRALAGRLDPRMLEARDRDGIMLGEALRGFGLDPERIGEAARRREELLAYAELHIEQGPVLEAEGLPVGVVTALNGYTRMRVGVEGTAGHAGTVPMALRRDALAAAAECVLAVERIGASDPGLVATVGRLEALPGAANVIPGGARFTVDLRSAVDEHRVRAAAQIEKEINTICARRGVAAAVERTQEQGVVACAPWLVERMARAVADEGLPVRRLPSGAGHDGMALAPVAEFAMLFVRCARGISHNPAEAISAADAATGARVLLRFVQQFRPRQMQ